VTICTCTLLLFWPWRNARMLLACNYSHINYDHHNQSKPILISIHCYQVYPVNNTSTHLIPRVSLRVYHNLLSDWVTWVKVWNLAYQEEVTDACSTRYHIATGYHALRNVPNVSWNKVNTHQSKHHKRVKQQIKYYLSSFTSWNIPPSSHEWSSHMGRM